MVILASGDPDREVLQHAEDYLRKLGVAHECVVVGPDTAKSRVVSQLANLEDSGAAVFIAGSRRGIGFACDIAKATTLPVLGVPIVNGPIGCVDEYLRPFLEMPPGVATFAVSKPGAINAALFAATIISEHDSGVWRKLHQMRKEQVLRVRAMKI